MNEIFNQSKASIPDIIVCKLRFEVENSYKVFTFQGGITYLGLYLISVIWHQLFSRFLVLSSKKFRSCIQKLNESFFIDEIPNVNKVLHTNVGPLLVLVIIIFISILIIVIYPEVAQFVVRSLIFSIIPEDTNSLDVFHLLFNSLLLFHLLLFVESCFELLLHLLVFVILLYDRFLLVVGKGLYLCISWWLVLHRWSHRSIRFDIVHIIVVIVERHKLGIFLWWVPFIDHVESLQELLVFFEIILISILIYLLIKQWPLKIF